MQDKPDAIETAHVRTFEWWEITSYQGLLEKHLAMVKSRIRDLELEARWLSGELADLKLTERSGMRAFILTHDAELDAGAAADDSQVSFGSLLDFLGLADEA